MAPVNRGLALVLVVGVLGILAVLGSAFAVLARLERRSASQRVLSTRAYLLARSGIEDATARLEMDQDPDLLANRYGGEDWDCSGGGLSAMESGQEAYGAGRPDRDACPPRHAMRPSFFVRMGSGNPVTLPVDGRLRGLSGQLDPSRRASWSLRVHQSGFDLNGGDPASPPASGFNAVLRTMLGNLAEALDREDGTNDALPVDQAHGFALVDGRPPAGWESYEEVLALALANDRTRLEALQPYLALHPWRDLKVVAPGASQTMFANKRSWSDLKQGLDALGMPVRPPPDFERLGGRIVGRAPVELSWARCRKPALIALLGGLKGFYLDQASASCNFDPGNSGSDLIGQLRPATVVLNWSLATDECRGTADRILLSTSELDTWQAFEAFCDTLPFTGSSDLAQAKRDVLKANFNPNTGMNKCNPDASAARLVDKLDLHASPAPRGSTTEFGLASRGGERISASGRVLSADGRLLACRTLDAEIAPGRVLRLTAQSEFVAGELGDLHRAGDEVSYRTYGSPVFIPASEGDSGDRTFGHKLTADAGASLQTYPEPHTALPAPYDGQIRLATVEMADGDWGGGLRFLGRWTAGPDGEDLGSGPAVCSGDQLQPPASASVLDGSAPNTLHPDGLFVERYRIPKYASAGSMGPHRGTLSYWMKPAYNAARGLAGTNTRRHLLFHANRVHPSTETSIFALSWDQWRAAAAGTQRPRHLTFFWENTDQGADLQHEQYRQVPSLVPTPSRWMLINAFWEMEPPVQPLGNADLSLALRINRGTAAADQNEPWQYQLANHVSNVIAGPSLDFTLADAAGPACFLLGDRGNDWNTSFWGMRYYGAPDATYDELAIFDHGADWAAAFGLFQGLSSGRFDQGRYYKESEYPASGGLLAPRGAGRRAGEWFSAPIDLGRVLLTKLSWTQIVPPELRPPVADGRVRLELASAQGDQYLVAGTFDRPAGEPLGRIVSEPFRLHAVFQPNLPDPFSTPILDALALDDVTVSYRAAGPPAILRWKEEE